MAGKHCPPWLFHPDKAFVIINLQYTPGYKPQYIKLQNKAKIITPAKGAISGYSYKLEGRNKKAESIYDTTATKAPAKTIKIGVRKANPMTVNGKTVRIKFSKLKKKAQTVRRTSAIEAGHNKQEQ